MIHLKNLFPIQEQLLSTDPAAYQSMLDHLISSLQTTIKKYHGSVVNFCSGRLLIAFGTQITESPDAQSLNNAYAACGAIKSCFDSLKQEQALPADLEWSLGLDSGSVFCGLTGNQYRACPNYIGSPINRAARLSVSAENGQCMMTKDLIRQLGLDFDRHTIRRTLKGLGETAVVDTAESGVRILSGIFPKEIIELSFWEKNHLSEDFHNSGAAVKILQGMSGAGSSCFLQVNRDREQTYHTVYLSPYETDIPFGAVVQIIKDQLDVNKDGRIDSEEIDSLINSADDLPRTENQNLKQVLRKLLSLPSQATAITEADINKILEIIAIQLTGDHCFQIYNGEHINEESLRQIFRLARNQGVSFEIEIHLDKVPENNSVIFDLIEQKEADQLITFGLPQPDFISFRQVALAELELGTDDLHANTRDFIRKLYNSTNGNLRVLSQVCRQLRSSGVITVKSGVIYLTKETADKYFEGFSSHYEEWVISSLEEQNFRFVGITKKLATLGQQFRLNIAEKLLGEVDMNYWLSQEKAVQSLGVAMDSGLVIFSNTAIWSALQQNLPSGQRCLYHADITNILEDNPEGTPLSALAHHSFQTAYLDTTSTYKVRHLKNIKAGKYNLAAGNDAFQAGSYQSAAFHLNRAYLLLKDDLSQTEKSHLAFSLGSSLRHIQTENFADPDLVQAGFPEINRAEIFQAGFRNLTLEKVNEPNQIFWAIKCSLAYHQDQFRKADVLEDDMEYKTCLETILADFKQDSASLTPLLKKLDAADPIRATELELEKILIEKQLECSLDEDQIESATASLGGKAAFLTGAPDQNHPGCLVRLLIQLKIQLSVFLAYTKDPAKLREAVEILNSTLGEIQNDKDLLRTNLGNLLNIEAINNLAHCLNELDCPGQAVIMIDKAIHQARQAELHEIVESTLLPTREEIVRRVNL